MMEYEMAHDQSMAESEMESAVTNVAHLTALDKFYSDLEKSALLYLEFWSQISDEAPDLSRLEELGSAINTSVDEIEQHWHRLLRTISDIQTALRMYQKFLIEVRNDKEASENALAEAERHLNQKTDRKSKNKSYDLQDDDDDSDDSADEAILANEKNKKLNLAKKVFPKKDDIDEEGEEENEGNDEEGEEDEEEEDENQDENDARKKFSKKERDIEEGQNTTNASLESTQSNLQQRTQTRDETALAKKFNSVLRSKATLIKTSRSYISTRTLTWTTNLIVLVLILVGSFDYYLSFTRFRIIYHNLNAADASNRRISELQNIVSKVIDLELLDLGIYNHTNPEEILRKDIGRSIKELEDNFLEIAFNPIDLPDDLAQQLTNDSIKIHIKKGEKDIQEKYLTLNEGTLKCTTSAANIQKLRLKDIDETNPDVFYINYNNFNEFYVKLRETADLYSVGVDGQIKTHQKVFFYEVVGIASLLAGVFIILLPVAFKANKKKENILKLFLEIPDHIVSILYGRCDNFLSSWPLEDHPSQPIAFEDENLEAPPATQEENAQEGEQEEESHPQMPKTYSGNRSTFWKFTCRFFFAILVASVFFQLSFFLSRNMLIELSALMKEFNSTSVAESFFTFINNAEKQLLIDDTYPIAANQSAQSVLENMIRNMYKLDSDIHQQHSVNIRMHTDRFRKYFSRKMMLSPCDDMVDVIEKRECEDFASGAMTQGMAVALTRHFENLRHILNMYRKYKDQPNLDFEEKEVTTYVEVYKPPQEDNNKQKNNWLNILKTHEAAEIDLTQHLFIRHIFRNLMDQFKQEIYERVRSLIVYKSILWALFLLINAIGCLCFIGSWIAELRRDILNTMAMLPIIPTKLATSLDNVRRFVKTLPNPPKKSRK